MTRSDYGQASTLWLCYLGMLFDWHDDSGHHPDWLLVVDVDVLGVTARGSPSTLDSADLCKTGVLLLTILQPLQIYQYF